MTKPLPYSSATIVAAQVPKHCPDCRICMAPLYTPVGSGPPTPVCVGECNHMFHVECIKSMPGDKRCPLCMRNWVQVAKHS